MHVLANTKVSFICSLLAEAKLYVSVFVNMDRSAQLQSYYTQCHKVTSTLLFVCAAGICTVRLVALTTVYVIGFDKTRLPHTSSFITLKVHNSIMARGISCWNFGSIEWLVLKLQLVKVKKLDVCGSLVLSNPVTYTYYYINFVV